MRFQCVLRELPLAAPQRDVENVLASARELPAAAAQREARSSRSTWKKRVARGRSDRPRCAALAVQSPPHPAHYSPIPHAFVNPFHIICGERRGCGAKIFTNWENATPKNSQNRCARCEKIGLGLTEITEFPCQIGNCVWTNVGALRSNI